MKEKIKKFFIYFFISLMVLFFISIFFYLNFDKEIYWKLLIKHYSDLYYVINTNKIISFILYQLLYFFTVAFSIPIASFLTLVGAIFYGWLAILCVIPATIGSWVIFSISKRALNKNIPSKIQPYLKNIKGNFQKSPFRWLLFMRFLPVIPFWAVNIIPAFLEMKNKPYVLATLIGILPGTTIYVTLGNGFKEIIEEKKLPNLSSLSQTEIILPLTILAFLVIYHIFFAKEKN